MIGLRPYVLLVFVCAVSRSLLADERTCDCPDIADLRNREAEQSAAIQAYRDAIARWGGAPPAADEGARRQFQQTDVQSAINNATTQQTNKAEGVTDAACLTTIKESTACMKEAAAQHEHVHAGACHDHRNQHPLSIDRWSTLADYAREEIAAYEAEAAYVHGALVDLQARCRLRIEMKSEIWGGMEATRSNASARVLAAISTPDHQPSVSYRGAGTLEYKTQDAGPPKKVGDPMLMKLVPVCYAASQGSGTVPFNVVDGNLWRSTTPPYEPLLDLTFEIHPTDETHMLKGERGCPKQKTKKPFWSEWFTTAKTATTAANHILIDDWTFAPRPGVFADKIIKSACGQPAALPGQFAQFGPLAPCAETTTLTVRLAK
jgi:hypothetical protein